MADDLYYKPGSFYRIDDRTGFKVRAEKTRKEWTGLIVRDQSWEPRQPQDFVEGVRDDQTVWDARPRQTNVFVGPIQTQTTNAAHAGDPSVQVSSTAGMVVGDRIAIMLDNGSLFVTTIIAFTDVMITETSIFMTTETGVIMVVEEGSGTPLTISLADMFPYGSASGSLVTDWSEVASVYIG